jgi:hypothetical protein
MGGGNSAPSPTPRNESGLSAPLSVWRFFRRGSPMSATGRPRAKLKCRQRIIPKRKSRKFFHNACGRSAVDTCYRSTGRRRAPIRHWKPPNRRHSPSRWDIQLFRCLCMTAPSTRIRSSKDRPPRPDERRLAQRPPTPMVYVHHAKCRR